MKVLFFFLSCCILLLVNVFSGKEDSTMSLKSRGASNIYKLIWSDEFNQNGKPNPLNWTFENGFQRNEELQWYQPENAWCENGMLIIEARKENRPNPNYIKDSKKWTENRQMIQYTSACLKTEGLHSWKFGRFVMRARIDIRSGLWPAFWTLGNKGEWPRNGEIDIMEYYKNKLLANIACGTDRPSKAEWFSKYVAIDSLGGNKWAQNFHEWKMDWNDNEISLYVDNRLLNSVKLEKLVNKDGTGINPFKQPHYLLLNLAIGGLNGGDPETTTFPNRFEIDYVRVYKLNDQ